jgi:hypothetical protein
MKKIEQLLLAILGSSWLAVDASCACLQFIFQMTTVSIFAALLSDFDSWILRLEKIKKFN